MSLPLASVPGGIAHALNIAFGMTWEILWALILGFFLSGVVQSGVSKREVTCLLPDDSPRTLAISCGLGAASSSCSYAAVALARSIFRKGANFTAAMAFQFASTNLVIELGIILGLLIGWQFTLAEFVEEPLMVALLALMFKAFLSPRLLEMARRQAERGLRGPMEGHAEMDMSVTGDRSRRLVLQLKQSAEPCWSADGGQLVFQDTVDTGNIWKMNADGTGLTKHADGTGRKQLTFSPGFDGTPSWSPDGRKIAFFSARVGNWDIYVMNVDGSHQQSLTANDSGNDTAPAWQPIP